MMSVRPYTTVMIVPTATIGGFAGDALPAARLLASDIDPKVQRLSKSFLSTVVRVPVGRSVLQQQPILGQFGRFFSSTPETGPVNPLIDLDLIIKTPTPTTVKIMSDSIDDFTNSIDITLTPEQQEYVNMLKKKMRSGARSPRCNYCNLFSLFFFHFFFCIAAIYREVPREDEVMGMGNFVPKMLTAEEQRDLAEAKGEIAALEKECKE